MSPILESSGTNKAGHLMQRNIPGMTKTKVIEKVRAKMTGIIIVARINIKTWLRIGRDCKTVTCLCPFVINRVKTSCNQFTLCH